MSQKGIQAWKLINRLNYYARDLCSIYDISYCCDKSCCCMDFKHLPFQCACNSNETIASYVKGNYDFYDVEQIEKFIAWRVTSSETMNPGPSFTIIATIFTCFYYLLPCWSVYYRLQILLVPLFYCTFCY